MMRLWNFDMSASSSADRRFLLPLEREHMADAAAVRRVCFSPGGDFLARYTMRGGARRETSRIGALSTPTGEHTGAGGMGEREDGGEEAGGRVGRSWEGGGRGRGGGGRPDSWISVWETRGE
eukprot:767238-Hanusia_phi.AAC.2